MICVGLVIPMTEMEPVTNDVMQSLLNEPAPVTVEPVQPDPSIEQPAVGESIMSVATLSESALKGAREPVDARLLFQIEFDELMQQAEDACDALEPLESQVLSLKITGQQIPIGGSFPSVPLSDLLLLRDKSKIVYLQSRIIPLSEITNK